MKHTDPLEVKAGRVGTHRTEAVRGNSGTELALPHRTEHVRSKWRKTSSRKTKDKGSVDRGTQTSTQPQEDTSPALSITCKTNQPIFLSLPVQPSAVQIQTATAAPTAEPPRWLPPVPKGHYRAGHHFQVPPRQKTNYYMPPKSCTWYTGYLQHFSGG